MKQLSFSNSSPYVFQVISKVIGDRGIEYKTSKSVSLTMSDGIVETDVNVIIKRLSDIVIESSTVGPSKDDVYDWIDVVYKSDRSYHPQIADLMARIEENLKKNRFLVSDRFTICDALILAYLEKSRHFCKIKIPEIVQNWLKACLEDPVAKNIEFVNIKAMCQQGVCNLEDGGRFVELPGAVKGSVVVRFPPEASGYLHIGHAKAALLNQFYRDRYEGKLILRFDDTNPVKEKCHFEEIILEDVKLLELTPDMYSKTSDYFDSLLNYAEVMIKRGLAYCDNTPTDEMRQLRTQKAPSMYRDTSVDMNLARWEQLKAGKETDWCLRAKIDYASENGCLRDPTIYRYCPDPHPTSGQKYHVYPTYDFACPIVDSIEGVTHALRTSEYHDRDPQYLWFLDQLTLRKPVIFEYSRLSFQYTVLSKRKLTKVVDSHIVDGWDDPRMPTIRGLIRRGLTLGALKEFILAQGFSKSVVNMQTDKLWAFNKRFLEPISPRLIGLIGDDLVKAEITSDIPNTSKEISLVPKDETKGGRTIYFGRHILIEGSDSRLLKDGDIVTLINWGNAKVNIAADSKEIQLVLMPKNNDYSNTLKISWLNNESDVENIPLQIVTYQNLLNKSVLTPEDDFELYINKNSKSVTKGVGEPYFMNLKRGNIVQIMRKGFYRVDNDFGKDKILFLVELPSGTENIKKPDVNVVKKTEKEVKKEKNANVHSKDSREVKKTEKTKSSNKTTKIADVSSGQKLACKPDKMKKTKLGLSVSKEIDFSQWYTEVITKSELIDYYTISGCYVIRPHAFSIWEAVQTFFDAEMKKLGIQNCYFPIFVPESALTKEKDHINDFAPEVAWVTRAGSTDLAEPIAIRPTSETVIYPTIAKWIQSHRDLPLKLNQWCNVVRWEFKHPTPFIRTREFLWQEGHTVYADREDAVKEVYQILDLYERIYTELLAIPVVKGTKSEAEKFAGAEFTTTVEGYISACGRGLQGATSHHLGQNFSKMFDIGFEDSATCERKFVFQNSFGISTRVVGALVMVHGDDKGLVLPPRVAPIQVVIIPCGISATTTEEMKLKIYEFSQSLALNLKKRDVRVFLDNRENVTPGWKYNHWEMKGVPLRVEVGPKDLSTSTVTIARRDTGEKTSVSIEIFGKSISETLEQIQISMYGKALQDLSNNTVICEDWDSFINNLNSKKVIYSPFCGDKLCEEEVRKTSTSTHEEVNEKGETVTVVSMGAKTLCIPSFQPKKLQPGEKCIRKNCKNDAKCYALFGRSF
ncbi:Bifunctional glutamate/proline--tRNA ligase [Thelohanellus kitauei]|uniref:proline--tRNA ligase n=1 Tax=Thelohanellus kitauei TaxID=669202 RepID=A0A0C2N0W9_THEKT|nr:Bifunctional glutamate/proline--tRNA ligase [Thelohanellus kitauei]